MSSVAFPDIPLTQYSRRIQPVRAIRAFGRLVRNKEDTAQVFEIMRALAGRSIERGFRRLVARPEGRRAALVQEDLAGLFADRAWTGSSLPESVGAAYRAFMDAENLSAESLVAESVRGEAIMAADHPFAWYARRLRDIHDVWHVLTGYGRDPLGEACVVAFSYAQTGSLGFGFIGLAAAHEIRREDPALPARAAVLEAWRLGRQAAWLPAENYRALFAEPLEQARARLKICDPTIYRNIPLDRLARLNLRASRTVQSGGAGSI